MSSAPKPKPLIFVKRIRLLGFNLETIKLASISVDDQGFPDVVMFNGDPYLFGPAASEQDLFDGVLAYRQTRPYRLDVGK